VPFAIYRLDRNDIESALRYLEAHWGELRPEDFTTLDRLQDQPGEWRRRSAELARRLAAEQGPALQRRAALRTASTKYVRVIHIPDGSVRYILRERVLARPDLYRPDGPDEAYKLRQGPPPKAPPPPHTPTPPATAPKPPAAPRFDEELTASVGSLARNLGAGRQPPTPSYEETPEPGAAATQLPPPAQRAVRMHLSKILARIGLHNHGAKRRKSQRYTIMRQMKSVHLAGVHDWEGQLLVREDIHQQALAFFQDPTRGNSTNAEAAAVLLHEEIHGHSPLQKEGYEKCGAFIEEATTELLARYVMRQHLRGSFSGSAYNAELIGLDGVVRHALGVGSDKSTAATELAHRTALRAAAFMRDSRATPVKHRFDYVQLFADSLARAVRPDAHIFSGLDETQVAERRQQVAKRAYDHLTKHFDFWVRHD
jgi:hypothetical protein